jgi:pyruvate, water dikinase
VAGAKYVRFFEEDGEDDGLGGKCASLVSMTAAGLPVPPGFAVTTAAFDRFVNVAGQKLGELDVNDVAGLDAASADIRAEIERHPVPDEVAREIRRAYETLQARFNSELRVAVRSSATAEDLPGASFAGQQDTYLWVTGADAVIEHVRRCWASLYTSRAIVYRRHNGIPDDGLSMAVGVQKMVNARVSGVALTLNPLNGDRSKIVIDASYGVGEPIVAGRVTPDHIVLDKVVLTIVAEQVGSKHLELVGNVERPVEPDRRIRRCLTDAEVVAVARLAKAAEKHYRCPQDVEWAIDADRPDPTNVVVLQSRPETVHTDQDRSAGLFTTGRPT